MCGSCSICLLTIAFIYHFSTGIQEFSHIKYHDHHNYSIPLHWRRLKSFMLKTQTTSIAAATPTFSISNSNNNNVNWVSLSYTSEPDNVTIAAPSVFEIVQAVQDAIVRETTSVVETDGYVGFRRMDDVVAMDVVT